MKKYTTVNEFIEELTEPYKSEVIILREMILDIDSSIIEHLQWNAPSYMYHGLDRMTFLQEPTGISLVLHSEALVEENPSKVLAKINFDNVEDIVAKQDELKTALSHWLESL